MSPPDHDSDAALRAQIQGLEEQLQRLVRTEQRLYYAQRDLGRQLKRVEALNLFAIEASRCQTEEEILRRAIGTFFSIFAYDQALACLRCPDGGLRPKIVQSVKGSEGRPLNAVNAPLTEGEEQLERGVFLSASQLPPASPLLSDALGRFDRLFGPAAPEGKLLLLPLREGVDATAVGLLVLRRQTPVGFHETLAAPEDGPFLELFGRHVSAALTQFRLVEHLRQTLSNLARAQGEVVKRERLAALGELAAVVAHEVRNPVAVIFNSVAGIRRGGGVEGLGGELLSVISEEAERLNEMVSDLLDFARPTLAELKPERLDAIVRSAIARAQRAASENAVDIRVVIEGEPPVALGDERMLHQAVLNLLTNSLQASRPGAPVLVKLGREARGTQLWARLEVIDRGPGIAPEDLERIFQPFFTTKAKGSGLGLAVVKKVVEAHAGEVRVQSTPGEGSSFCLLIPGVEAAIEAAG